MNEDKIREMLEVPTERLTIDLPGPLSRRLLHLGYKKYGTKAKKEIMSKAGLWAVAIGIDAWERNLPRVSRKRTQKRTQP